MPLSLETLISLPEEVYTREIEAETLLLDAEGGRYFSLDPVGSRIWQLLCQHLALRPVYETLLTEYETSPENLAADLLALTEALVAAGLVKIRVE